MDLENMQRNWAQMNQRLNSVEEELNQIKTSSKETSQQRLVRQYRCLGLIGLLSAITFLIVLKYIISNAWIPIAVSAFFLMAACMDLYLMHKVGAIDVADMTVSKVAVQAKDCRRMHHLFQLILIPLGIAILGWMAFSIDDQVFHIGMCVGIVVGLLFGLKAYIGMMRSYKDLMKN